MENNDRFFNLSAAGLEGKEGFMLKKSNKIAPASQNKQTISPSDNDELPETRSRAELLRENRQLKQALQESRESSALAADLFMQQLASVVATQQNLEKANDRLRKLSNVDGLTGLSNRRYFDKMLASEWRRCRRHQVPLSCIMIDIDDFKRFNDTHGHLAGDERLQLVAGCLQQVIQRSSDTVARYGGEEFILLLPGSTLETAQKAAEKIILALEKEQSQDAADKRVTVSQGIATLIPNEDFHSSSLLLQADSALYRAKRGGKNRLYLYD